MIAVLALTACVYTAGPPPVRRERFLHSWSGTSFNPNNISFSPVPLGSDASLLRFGNQPTALTITGANSTEPTVIFKSDGSIVLGEHATPTEAAKAMLEILEPMLKLRAGACP